MRTWTNDKGEVCVGNECFHVKGSGEDVVVHYNSNNPQCDVDVKKAVDKMFGLMADGGKVKFRHIKG